MPVDDGSYEYRGRVACNGNIQNVNTTADYYKSFYSGVIKKIINWFIAKQIKYLLEIIK